MIPEEPTEFEPLDQVIRHFQDQPIPEMPEWSRDGSPLVTSARKSQEQNDHDRRLSSRNQPARTTVWRLAIVASVGACVIWLATIGEAPSDSEGPGQSQDTPLVTHHIEFPVQRLNIDMSQSLAIYERELNVLDQQLMELRKEAELLDLRHRMKRIEQYVALAAE